MTRRRGARATAVALAGVLALGACTGDEPAPPAPPTTPTPSTGATPAPSATADGGTGGWAGLGEGAPAGEPGPELVGLGAKWDWSRAAQTAGWIERSGGGPTFYEVVWCDVEPREGEREWSAVDQVLDRAEDLGVDLGAFLLKVRTGRCWATGGTAEHPRGGGAGTRGKTESAPPLDTAAYTDFVTELVGRGAERGVRSWAVENEVNAPAFWAGSAEEYADLARVAAAAVRAADPGARVLDSGVSSVAHGYGVVRHVQRTEGDEAAVEAWNAYYANRIGTRGQQLPRVADAAALADVLAGEPAQRSLAQLDVVDELVADGTVDARQVHFYEPWDQVAPLFSYLRDATPADVPLEVWELGAFARGGEAPDVEPAVRDADVLRATAAVLAEGATVAVWLPLAVNPDGRNPDEPRWGLLDGGGRERGASAGFTALAQAADRGGVRAVPVDTGAVRGVALVGGTGFAVTAVVWADEAPVALGAGLDAVATVTTDAAGVAAAAPADADEVGEAPVVVTAPDVDALVAGLA